MLVLSRTGSFVSKSSRPPGRVDEEGVSDTQAGATHTRRRARPSGSRGAREMPSSRPVSARRPGHDIPEKIVVRCVLAPDRPPPLRLCAAPSPAWTSAAPAMLSLPPCTPRALLPLQKLSAAAHHQRGQVAGPRLLSRGGCALRRLSCKLGCICPWASCIRATVSGPAPSCPCCCQVLGSIAATTIFFAFALTTFVVWIRCVSALRCCA